MTPRMAWRLWQAALYLGDEWRTCIDDPALLAVDLPPIARRHARHREWLEQFVGSFDRLAVRLGGEDGDDVLARCTADELALHLVIDLAQAFTGDDAVNPDAMSGLPDHGDDDVNFGLIRDVLFEDHDVLMLSNASLDGVEREPVLRTEHLDPRQWFEPFARPLAMPRQR